MQALEECQRCGVFRFSDGINRFGAAVDNRCAEYSDRRRNISRPPSQQTSRSKRWSGHFARRSAVRAVQQVRMLARRTGCPITVFHIGVEYGKTFEKTWDHFLLPLPYSRAVVIFAPPIEVPANADANAMEVKHNEMQKELERVRDIAEAWFTLPESDRHRYRSEFAS